MLSAVPSGKGDGHNGNGTAPNPFNMPEDHTVFHFKTTQKAQQKLDFQRDLNQPVYEKKTYLGRMKARQQEMRKKLRDGIEEKEERTTNRPRADVHLPQKIPVSMAMVKDRNIEKESIQEYVSKKREMFYLEYALAVKREEIAKLEALARREEKKLAKAEKLLEDDAVLFDAFLKENDKSSVEAIRIAEHESKAKLEKVAEIKKVTAKMVAIKSNISKFEDTLQEYKLYRDFLFKLSPPEWQEKQRGEKKSRGKLANTGEQEETTGEDGDPGSRELPPVRETRVPSKPGLKSTPQNGQNISPASGSDSSEYEEEPELYFTQPQQLLDLLSELEERNLTLIQNSQETEESLEEFKQLMEKTRESIEQEADYLKQQIDGMTQTLQREKEKTAELELSTRFFDFGKTKAEEESTLNALGQKVEEVYRSCIGDAEPNLSTLQMLKAIESQLGDLLERVERIPADRLALAERAKDKERRVRLRDEKLTLQKRHQEERLKKAMERAQAEIKRTSGRKLMPRSQPPVHKVKNKENDDITDKEKEEYLYFFS